ncbi:carbon starvation CstA family protein [Tuberibacillus sp. Marseille-P3662]|uniref:carbon starvation CstA family protein n=1 Tax=Tuberibacillus sp. Marseille-P3662 TaxID=1965358 RepID=UPI000A1C891A|nr:carbon starvation protein A [Tuberibacillus sp. Marseille-P3662]
MSAIWLVVFGFIAFFLGYKYYSNFVAQKVLKLDRNYVTPAHEYKDGVDYVPTNKFVLWGHHFSSVAGAAPILGPAIAVFWGWLPALLWVVLGTIFAAGVHDFGTLVLSVRHKGRSVGNIADRIVGSRAKILFLFIILILVLMVNAVFAWAIANLFVTYPAAVLPVFIEIPLAVWIGYKVYKKSGNMLLPSVIALAIMYGIAVLTSYVPALEIDFVSWFGGEGHTVAGLGVTGWAFFIWIVILMVYAYIASTLPVWKLLQPRDYINSHQLVVGLLVLFLGLFLSNPEVTAPAMNTEANVPWFPLLFITIACGAISGFHGLVASGTSSKQLDRETDARFVGYFGAVGEGTLALLSIIAVVTLFSSQEAFMENYATFSLAQGGGLGNFIAGAAQLAHEGLAVPMNVATTIVSIIVISFAATSLDTSVRLMRYIISELGVEYKKPVLTKMHVATSIGVIASAALALLPQGPKGFGSGGYLIWPLFGTSNQLLAGISLLLVSIWLKNKGRNYVITLIPMFFLMFMTIWAMAQSVFFQWSGYGDHEFQGLLFILGLVIFCFAIWIVIESLRTLSQKTPPTDQSLKE